MALLSNLWSSSVAAAASSTYMPPAGTSIASQVDSIYGFLLVASVISFILLIGGMIYFVFKYQRSPTNMKSAYITHDYVLEFLWSFIPLCIFLFVFAWGWYVYHQMRSYPENALEVHVVGKKWAWRFVYKNGKEVLSSANADGSVEPATMVVPVNRDVKLIMSSEKVNPGGNDPLDRPVIHSFFIPAFRIKQDVVPGRYTAEWFRAEHEGEFWVFCAEYCGAGHYSMKAKVKVVSNADFEKWLSSEAIAGGSLADKGRALFAAKACIGCHSLDGSRIVGPSFKGLFGTKAETSSGDFTVDEDYIRKSVLTPSWKTVKGYPAGTMPAFAGQVSEDDIKALIEFIKSVK
jgi:cytochrome c oxidase subunit II